MSSHEKSKKHVLLGSVISLVGKVGGIIFQFVHMLIMARMLGGAALGVYSVSLTLASILSSVMRLGMETGSLKIISEAETKGNRDEVIKTIAISGLLYFIFSIVLGFLFIVFSGPVITLFKIGEDKSILYLVVIMAISMGWLLLLIEWIRAIKKVRSVAILQNIVLYLFAIVFMGIGYYYLSAEPGWIAVVSSSLAYLCTASIALIVFCKSPSLKNVKYHASGILSGEKIKNLLKISIPLMFINITWSLLTWTDVLTISFYLQPEDVGIYTASLRLATLVSVLLMAINAVIPPIISDLYHEGRIKELESLLQSSSRYVLSLSMGVGVFTIAFGDYLLSLFGSDFSNLGMEPLVVLVVGRVFGSAAGSVGFTLIMSNNQGLLSVLTVMCGILNIVLNILLIPKIGIIGAAIATALVTIIWNIVACIIVWKILKIKTFSDRLLKNTAIGLCSMVIFYYLLNSVNGLVASFSSVFIYAVLVLIWIAPPRELFAIKKYLNTYT